MKKLLIIPIFLFGCRTTQSIIKDFDKDIKFCSLAEKNLQKLECAEGKPTKKGKTFEEFCKETEENKIFLNAECLSTITSCQEVNQCTGSK